MSRERGRRDDPGPESRAGDRDRAAARPEVSERDRTADRELAPTARADADADAYAYTDADADADRPIGPDGRPWDAQPKWRRDFPIDVDLDDYVARRDFTKFLVLVSGAFVVGQLWILLQNLWRRATGELPVRRVARLDEVPVGGSLAFDYPDDESHAVLVRLGEDRIVAYDRACTHLLCPVIAQPERGRLHCPCHDGDFDVATGRPVKGPPERPLPRVRLEIRGGVIYATGIEERTA